MFQRMNAAKHNSVVKPPKKYDIGALRWSPSGAMRIYVEQTIVMNMAGTMVIQKHFFSFANHTVIAQRVKTESVWFVQAK